MSLPLASVTSALPSLAPQPSSKTYTFAPSKSYWVTLPPIQASLEKLLIFPSSVISSDLLQPESAATIEIPVDGAVMVFEWRFDSVGEGMTLLTQRIVLHGENARSYLGYAKTLEENLPLGMRKMASAIERALAETLKRHD